MILSEVLSRRRSGLRDWGWFALVALLPVLAVALLGLRAARNEQAAVRREMALELERAASTLQQSYDGTSASLAELPPPRLGGPRDPLPQAPFADPVVLAPEGELRRPPGAQPSEAGPKSGAPKQCAKLAVELAERDGGAGAKEARKEFLHRCEEAQSSRGRYLWPVVALDPASSALVDPAQLGRWFRRNGAALGAAERAAARSELRAASWLPADVSRQVLAALDEAPTADRELQAVLRSKRPLLAVDPAHNERIRWSDGRSRGALQRQADDGYAGYVVHAGSLSRAARGGWPTMPNGEMTARLVTQPQPSAGPAVELLDRSMYLQLGWTAPDAVQARTRESMAIMLGAVGLAVAVALLLAGLLFARMRAERRLSALRTDFVATVSHELRTPIASLRMLSELLEQGEVEEEEQAEVYGALARESRRLGSTVHRLLTFSRMEARRARLSRQPTSVTQLLRDAVQTFQERHPEVRLVGPDDADDADDVTAQVDGPSLAMAVDNLLSNAHKYAPDGQPYEISVRQEGGELQVAVRDQGPGIARSDQRRIFRPFERVDERLSEATEGSGIGLSLVQHVARAHGGRAWVESEPAEGATFTIALPKEAP